MGQYYFSTQQLTVGYDGVPLIRDIQIDIEKGEIVTLIGPNGAGKSTILKSITRQLKTLAGTVVIGGTELKRISYKELSTKMAVVLTERMKPELMTCRDIVATGRYPYTGRLGILSAEDERQVEAAMAAVRWTCPTGTSTPSPTASASGCCWPAPSARTRRSSYWMSPPPSWTSATSCSC